MGVRIGVRILWGCQLAASSIVTASTATIDHASEVGVDNARALVEDPSPAWRTIQLDHDHEDPLEGEASTLQLKDDSNVEASFDFKTGGVELHRPASVQDSSSGVLLQKQLMRRTVHSRTKKKFKKLMRDSPTSRVLKEEKRVSPRNTTDYPQKSLMRRKPRDPVGEDEQQRVPEPLRASANVSGETSLLSLSMLVAHSSRLKEAIRAKLKDVPGPIFLLANVISMLVGMALVALTFQLKAPEEKTDEGVKRGESIRRLRLSDPNVEASDSQNEAKGAISQISDMMAPLVSGGLEAITEEDQTKDYDFMITEQGGKGENYWPYRFWKWHTQEEAENLGVAVQAPTPSYHGYQRIELEASEKGVEAAMVRCGINVNKFHNMEELLWKLLRAECYFMADKHANLVLMIETVRLRCINNSRILVQEPDGSMLHQKAGLPGVEKPCSQSPVYAAKLFWEQALCMPTEAADFIEDRTEDHEIRGFQGLRCVERAHVMSLKVISQDATLIGQIGLPSHRSFAPQRQADDRVDTPFRFGGDVSESMKGKKFSWMTFEQFLQIGGTLSNADVTGSALLKGSVEKEELVKFLQQGGLRPDDWDDRGEDRALRALQKEMSAGKTYLEMNSYGILRVLDIVALRLWSPDRQLILIDKGRRNDYGDEEWRAQLPGGKKENTKSLREAAIATARVVNCAEDDLRFPDELTWEYSSFQKNSERYRGLPTKYRKFFVDAILEDEDDLLQQLGLAGMEMGYGPTQSMGPEALRPPSGYDEFAGTSSRRARDPLSRLEDRGLESSPLAELEGYSRQLRKQHGSSPSASERDGMLV